jgi:tRNA-splicing ligase RtcB
MMQEIKVIDKDLKEKFAAKIFAYRERGINGVPFDYPTIKDDVLNQFKNCIMQPYVINAALMPGSHLGYVAPIESVIETEEFIVPSWVGYDIGCGVISCPTNFDVEKVYEKRWDILEKLKEKIPTGFNHNSDSMYVDTKFSEGTDWYKKMYTKKKGGNQMGTLGGGNHFLSVDVDHCDGKIWITIHSGSRGVGWSVADHYMKAAKEGEHGSNPLSIKFPIGKNYIRDYTECTKFARLNRLRILYRASGAIREVIEEGYIGGTYDSIECVHNNLDFTSKNTIIHRKGAVSLPAGVAAVIPANMSDGTYIVQGIGNEDSLNSCSHGAGRTMSRKQAKLKLDSKKFKRDMGQIACDTDGRLDEAPDAYHNIKSILNLHEDILRITNHLRPIIVLKG